MANQLQVNEPDPLPQAWLLEQNSHAGTLPMSDRPVPVDIVPSVAVTVTLPDATEELHMT